MTDRPHIIVGNRIKIGQAILGLANGSVILYNYLHPDNPIPAGMVGLMMQPVIFFVQIWWVNKMGITT